MTEVALREFQVISGRNNVRQSHDDPSITSGASVEEFEGLPPTDPSIDVR